MVSAVVFTAVEKQHGSLLASTGGSGFCCVSMGSECNGGYTDGSCKNAGGIRYDTNPDACDAACGFIVAPGQASSEFVSVQSSSETGNGQSSSAVTNSESSAATNSESSVTNSESSATNSESSVISSQPSSASEASSQSLQYSSSEASSQSPQYSSSESSSQSPQYSSSESSQSSAASSASSSSQPSASSSESSQSSLSSSNSSSSSSISSSVSSSVSSSSLSSSSSSSSSSADDEAFCQVGGGVRGDGNPENQAVYDEMMACMGSDATNLNADATGAGETGGDCVIWNNNDPSIDDSFCNSNSSAAGSAGSEAGGNSSSAGGNGSSEQSSGVTSSEAGSASSGQNSSGAGSSSSAETNFLCSYYLGGEVCTETHQPSDCEADGVGCYFDSNQCSALCPEAQNLGYCCVNSGAACGVVNVDSCADGAFNIDERPSCDQHCTGQ